MKNFLLIYFLFNLSAYAQDSLSSFSLYFESDHCKHFTLIDGLTKTNYLGKYQLNPTKHNTMRITAGDEPIISEKGIYISKNKLISISREEVRENSKYRVKNNYLHGVIINDSLPVIIEDDAYYFLMPTKAYLYNNSNNSQSLWKTTNGFLIFSKENNNYYSALKLIFLANNLSLSELDISYNKTLKIKHSIAENPSIKTFILKPTKKDWTILLNEFIIYDTYQKIK